MLGKEKIQKPIYDIVIFENRFPSLSLNPSEPAIESTEFYPARSAGDECEIIVYKPNHNSALADKPGGRISDFKS